MYQSKDKIHHIPVAHENYHWFVDPVQHYTSQSIPVGRNSHFAARHMNPTGRDDVGSPPKKWAFQHLVTG